MTTVASADVTRLADALRETARQSNITTREVLISASNQIKAEMEVRVPVHTGELRDSIGIRVEADKVVIGPTAAHAPFVEFGTAPHEIRPKNPNGVLVFKMGGQTIYAKKVNHPGTKAQPFVRPAFMAWVDSLGELVADANIKVLKEAAE